MKKNFFLLMALLVAASCAKKVEPTISEDFNMSGIILPDEIECYAGETLELRVLSGRGPVLTDLVELSGSKQTLRMPISEAESNRFTFALDPNLHSGDYKMSIVRDGRVRGVGRTRLIISTGIEIDPRDATIYGQVASEGKGVKDVVVSDGVLVTKTDENGIYRLASAKKNKFVFVSVPSGYEPFSNGFLPCIHKQLRASKSVAERADFSLLPAPGQDNCKVLLLGDIHLANRHNDRAQFVNFVEDINAYTAANAGTKMYGLTLGDMVWDLYWKVNAYGYEQYIQDANNIKNLMIYQTIGNHDHSMYYPGDFETVAEYKQQLAPTYYSFNIGKYHFVVLDDIECKNATPTTDAKGNPCYEREHKANLVSDVLTWLEKDLSYVPKSTPLVVTMHIPLYNKDGSYRYETTYQSSAKSLENMLDDFSEVHLFTAHTHKMYNVDKLSSKHIYEHNAGAICATWWMSGYDTPGIHISQDGTPGGYTVLDLAGTSPTWQYKPIGAPIERQFRTYDRNCIHITADKYTPSATQTFKDKFNNLVGLWKTASSANEVYINVWNVDAGWKVEVSENGTWKNATKVSTTGIMDPLHLIASSAKRYDLNSDPSFPTEATDHIYKYTAGSATSTLEIKVTDCFGNVYTETMERPKPFDIETYKK